MTDLCDHKSVGVIIEGSANPSCAGTRDRFLLFQRVKPPVGVAPVAGHIDDFTSVDRAMEEEVREETGLTLIHSRLLVDGFWRHNRCRRQPSGPNYGHEWWVMHGFATGVSRAKADESKDLRWYTREDLQLLAIRTSLLALNYESGGKYGISPEEFNAHPGIEPVWVEWLWRAELITMSEADREAIDLMASRSLNS